MSEVTIALSLTRSAISDFVLTPPPSHEVFVIAESQSRFDGRCVEDSLLSVEVADPEEYGGEPDWEKHGFRGQVAKLLWARGLQKKAIRFVSCQKCARPGVCSRYPLEHKFFVPNGCEVVFCKECADEVRRDLLAAYVSVVRNAVLRFVGEQEEFERLSAVLHAPNARPQEWAKAETNLRELWKRAAEHIRRMGWVLWRVNFTLRSDGSEIAPDRVKGMNSCVRSVMRQTVGSRKGFGLLFADEVGYEKRGHLPDSRRVAHGLNLHCHGLYFGPGLDWYKTRNLWMAATEKQFGVPSRGFFYRPIRGFTSDPERAVRWALNHMLKYVSKPPAVTPQRLASLVAAFDRARRVHSLGLFYGKKPKKDKKECLCPKCRTEGIASTVSFEGRALPNGGCIPRLDKIELLLSQGYVPLREAGRYAVLAMGASP